MLFCGIFYNSVHFVYCNLQTLSRKSVSINREILMVMGRILIPLVHTHKTAIILYHNASECIKYRSMYLKHFEKSGNNLANK